MATVNISVLLADTYMSTDIQRKRIVGIYVASVFTPTRHNIALYVHFACLVTSHCQLCFSSDIQSFRKSEFLYFTYWQTGSSFSSTVHSSLVVTPSSAATSRAFESYGSMIQVLHLVRQQRTSFQSRFVGLSYPLQWKFMRYSKWGLHNLQSEEPGAIHSTAIVFLIWTGLLLKGSPDTLGGVAFWLRAARLRNGGRVAETCKTFLASQSSLICSWYWGALLLW
jgi:hypothetical protein